jgi:hypothetical protein
MPTTKSCFLAPSIYFQLSSPAAGFIILYQLPSPAPYQDTAPKKKRAAVRYFIPPGGQRPNPLSTTRAEPGPSGTAERQIPAVPAPSITTSPDNGPSASRDVLPSAPGAANKSQEKRSLVKGLPELRVKDLSRRFFEPLAPPLPPEAIMYRPGAITFAILVEAGGSVSETLVREWKTRQPSSNKSTSEKSQGVRTRAQKQREELEATAREAARDADLAAYKLRFRDSTVLNVHVDCTLRAVDPELGNDFDITLGAIQDLTLDGHKMRS